jgi:hypothetical protein
VAELRFSSPKFTENFSDAHCFNAATEQFLELGAAC